MADKSQTGHDKCSAGQRAFLALEQWDQESVLADARMKAGKADPHSELSEGSGGKVTKILADRWHVAVSYVSQAKTLRENDEARGTHFERRVWGGESIGRVWDDYKVNFKPEKPKTL